MKTKINELSVMELKILIHDTVKETIDNMFEDLLALSSTTYLKSIERARKDYKKGKFKTLEELDV